ncbi:MAG TPA: phytanoyl-CoA dioxygenase family protein [Tepidisphaeraceae bacterium]|jgi:ectoine hydroxylase-related dioxygenase (phytanoyl-CoA dioxygenase family)
MTQQLHSLVHSPTDSEVAAYRRDGFVVMRGLFDDGEVESIRRAFMDQNKDGPTPGLSEIKHQHAGGASGYDPGDPLSFYPRMMNPHEHATKEVGQIARRFMLDGRIKAVLEHLFGETPCAAQSMFYFKPPGARGQDFHQDNFYLKVKPGNCVAAWIAVDRCDEGNGGMMCVPETGDYPVQCPEKADPRLYFTTEHVPIPAGKVAVLPVMEPGDVLFFNGSTVHGSGPNASADRFRRSLIFHYVPASATEISHWYTVLDFDGRPVTHIKVSQDGGPCGTPHETAAPH